MNLEKLMSANLEAVYTALEKMPEAENAKLVNDLLLRCAVTYDDKAHGPADEWRNAVACDLNVILGRIEFELNTRPDESDIAFALAALRIVERVAEFEQITEVDESSDEFDRQREQEYQQSMKDNPDI